MLHAGLRLFEEATILLALQTLIEQSQRTGGIADQARFHRIAQADALTVAVDLHAACLARLRVILDIGKG